VCSLTHSRACIGSARKIGIWFGGGVLGHVCAGGESRREQRSRWRGTARRHQRPSSPRVCVTKSPCPKRHDFGKNLGCMPWRRDKDMMARGEARASSMEAAPESDRLGSMAGSQATVGLHGGAKLARSNSGHTRPNEHTRLVPTTARRPGPRTVTRVVRLTLCFWTQRRDGGDEGEIGTTMVRLEVGEVEQHGAISSRSGSYSAAAT
jgi:hypothetical protein